ncbi:MAG: KpsF/GutQ family sugar-phosphate isomerase [Leeuwenhoekiella sp.]
MNTHEQIVASARRTISIERDAISNLLNILDDAFVAAVRAIYNSKGRVIVTGVGKSAIIAQKIVATLNSTGTPAVFMHAADAVHGDLGLVLRDDTVLCLSKSGDTPEIKVLVPFLKNLENTLIAMTANKDSFLGKNADVVIHAAADHEACPNNLAPTTSTTVQLALGDALAIALLDLRGFSEKDFARYHPGGTLGKKLYLRVSDLVRLHEKPIVHPDTPIKDVISEISRKMLGVTAVLNGRNIVGIVTDGDIRRMLEKNDVLTGLTASDVMSTAPKTVVSETLAVKALELMERHQITQLLAVNADGDFDGVVHLHDLIKEGII